MRWITGVLAIVLAGLASARPAGEEIRADNNAAAQEEIKKLELHLIDLILKGDPAYGTYLAEDYVLIESDGELRHKTEMVQQFTSRDPRSGSGSMTPSEMQVRIYGDTAVMNFKLTTGRMVNDELRKKVTRATKVFIRRNGRWYMVNNQGTPLASEASQSD